MPTYLVKTGDYMQKIAKQFNVPLYASMRIRKSPARARSIPVKC